MVPVQWLERMLKCVREGVNIGDRFVQRGKEKMLEGVRGKRERRGGKDTNSPVKGLSEMFPLRIKADVIFRRTRGSGVTSTSF